MSGVKDDGWSLVGKVTPVQVDELDLRIVQQLVIGKNSEPKSERESMQRVAKNLAVHSNTVAARVRNMTAKRALLPMTVQLQPHNLGFDVAHIFFPVPPERRTRELEERFFQTPGVHYFWQYVEGWTIIIYGTNAEDIRSRVAPLERASGATGQWEVVSSRDWTSETNPTLDDLDLRIVGALLSNSRWPLPRLARTLRVPLRTLRRRHARLFAQRALRYIPHGSTPLQGMVTGYLILEVPGGRNRERVVSQVQSLVRDFWSGRVMNRSIHYWTFGRDVGAVTLQAAGVRSVAGVSNVRLRILERFFIADMFPTYAVDLLTKAMKHPRAGAQSAQDPRSK